MEYTILAERIRLIIGYIKAGKTYGEIMRMFSEREFALSILVTINQKLSRDQTIEQALEIGFKEKDIIRVSDINKINQKFPSLAGKICIVNLNENYDTKIGGLINESHRQNLRVNYSSDEYDQNAAIMVLGKPMARHTLESRWISSLQPKDVLTFISATNATGYYSDIKFTEVKIAHPYNQSLYKGMNDIIIKTLDDISCEHLARGEVPISIIERIKTENSSFKKALIKVTNRVHDRDDYLTQESIFKKFLEEGLSVVMVNGKSNPTIEEYDAATVIITGQMANRTKEFKNIYSQYLDFGKNLWDGAIIQTFRLCGYRDWTPILYIPKGKEKRVHDAIKEENKYYTEDMDFWTDRDKKTVIPKGGRPLQGKIAGQKRTKIINQPEYIMSEDQYIGVLQMMYPLIDDINCFQTKGTRKYGDKDVDYLVNSLINTWSKDRVQKSRNIVIPNKDGIIPMKGTVATSIGMGVFYDTNMTQFAAYYIDPDTYELKIALWNTNNFKEDKEIFSVETKSRAAT